MVAAQIYEIVFIPFQKSVKFCFFWRKMGGSWVGREHSECLEHSEKSEHLEKSECLEHSEGLGDGILFFRGGYRMPSMMFSILIVAWKAASIWSTSRPRVLMMWPL